MYPLFRFGLETARARRLPPLAIDEPHVSRHTCLPTDIDPWWELNNGRTLTLYDFGRIALMLRTGVSGTLKTRGWGIAVAGISVRYRRRVRLFDRFEMRSRLVGRDDRFFYFHQSMWRGGDALSSLLVRSAVTADGIVETDAVVAAVGAPGWRPTLPDWVSAWIDAEARRPWPPAP